MQNSYLTLEHQTTHPILNGLEGVLRVINGVRRVHVRPAASSSKPPLTLVPSYPDLPVPGVAVSEVVAIDL